MKETTIARTYRIKPSQDKGVKKLSVKCKCSESEFIRQAIDARITTLTKKT